MFKRIIILSAFFIAQTFCALQADEIFEDITGSVIVGVTFEITGANVPIDFGLIQPEEEVILYPDRYFNEVRCRSNSGKTWYLKAFCKNLEGTFASISSKHLKFRIYRTDGQGTYSTEWMEFSDKPVLIYTSAGNDNLGKEVRLQFVYKFRPPPKVPGGNYTASVSFIMTERQ